MTRRLLLRSVVLAATMLLVSAGTLSQPAAPAPTPPDEVGAYLSKMNDLRASVGVASLGLDGDLSWLAQGWNRHLADRGSLAHAPDLSAGVTAPWLRLGENVGFGPSTDEIFRAFVNSPGHYANLVDPRFDRVGIAVVWVGDRQYTTHRFMATAETPPPPLAAPAAPIAPAAPTSTEPPPLVAPPATPERIGTIIGAFRALPA